MYYRVDTACIKSLFIFVNPYSSHKQLLEGIPTFIRINNCLFLPVLSYSNKPWICQISPSCHFFLYWARMFFLIQHLHKKWWEKGNILSIAFINIKSLSVTITYGINRSCISDFRLSKHQLKLSSRSAFKYAKETEKVNSVLVIPTISNHGNRYLSVLYVQSIIKIRRNACNNSMLAGWAQRI